MDGQRAPKPKADEEVGPNPAVAIGDEVFFNHPSGPMSGKVVCHGRHGATLKAGDETHKILWKHILGHKKRIPGREQETGLDYLGHPTRTAYRRMSNPNAWMT